MTWVLQICGWAANVPCPHLGQFVESFQHDTSDGRGRGDFTADPRRAMQFATAGEALEFWKRQSTTKPLREDGRPNRPLTAAHCSIITLDEAFGS
jgi:hypothetical protein